MNMKQIIALIWNSDCSAETCRSLVTEIEELEEKAKRFDLLEQANKNLLNCIESLLKSEAEKRKVMGDFR